MTESVVEVQGLTRRFGAKTALDNVMKMVGGVYRMDGDILVISDSPDSPVMRERVKTPLFPSVSHLNRRRRRKSR